MSTSIRICSYLLLPLIYLLVNVKIAQLGESFPITIVTFLPVLLLLFLERISVKKLMIALGIGAGLTAFNYLFGQSLDASKYVTSTMLFVYIVIIIGMVWSIRFKTISPHNHRKILRFFYLVVGLVVALAAKMYKAGYAFKKLNGLVSEFSMGGVSTTNNMELCADAKKVQRQILHVPGFWAELSWHLRQRTTSKTKALYNKS